MSSPRAAAPLPRSRRSPYVVMLAVALAVPFAALPAAAAPGGSGGRTELVLLTLKPHDRAALRQLAAGHRGAAASSSLRAALPSAGERGAVADTARRLGLTVRRTSPLALLVSGPAERIATLFGSARAVDPTSPTQHPLPHIPEVFGGSVVAALGGDDTRPAFRPMHLSDGTADGSDFRTAYGDGHSAVDPAQLPSGLSGIAEQAETIATVQLSSWHSSDLNAYRQQVLQPATGESWPTPKYSAVNDPLLPPKFKAGDAVEVDLDQESIYSIAPYANQRAYFSGNDLLGMYDSLQSIGDDASDPTTDRHIVAASISWGFCETDLLGDPGASSLFQTFEDVLSYDLANGVTVFASTGDNGGRCDGSRIGVDYPASSPQVIAVGGTQNAGDPADPTTQQGWSDQEGASGGGVSEVFPRPSYQPASMTGSAFRAIPDVSALAGAPFFDIYSSAEQVGLPGAPNPNVGPVFGTSLASPVTAATYAVQVAQHSYAWGVGDILPGLYAQPGNFTDVNDGCTQPASSCPGFNGVDVARAGYDEVTGLGTPLWGPLLASGELGGDPHLSVGVAYTRSLTVPVAVRIPDWQANDYNRYRIDVDGNHNCTVNDASPTPPTHATIDDGGFSGAADGVHDLTLVAFNAPASAADVPGCHYADAFVFVDTTRPEPTAGLTVVGGSAALQASWGGQDPDSGSGIGQWSIRLSSGGSTVLSETTKHGGHVDVKPRAGHVYTLTVTATDRAGNSRTVTATLADDRQLSKSRGWSSTSSRAAFAGTLLSSSRRGATAALSASGNSYHVWLTTCSSCGKVGVYVGGRLRKTIDTYASRTHARQGFLAYTTSSVASRRVVLKVLGTKNGRSHGTTVLVDAVAVDG